jgi:hypothetical protein
MNSCWNLLLQMCSGESKTGGSWTSSPKNTTGRQPQDCEKFDIPAIPHRHMNSIHPNVIFHQPIKLLNFYNFPV